MEKLTGKQKAIVRKEAQKIKATFQVGKNELTVNNLKAIKETFNNKEIVKVKVNRENLEDKTITHDIANVLSSKIPCEVAGIIGTTIILYKENKKIDNQLFIKNKN